MAPPPDTIKGQTRISVKDDRLVCRSSNELDDEDDLTMVIAAERHEFWLKWLIKISILVSNWNVFTNNKTNKLQMKHYKLFNNDSTSTIINNNNNNKNIDNNNNKLPEITIRSSSRGGATTESTIIESNFMKEIQCSPEAPAKIYLLYTYFAYIIIKTSLIALLHLSVYKSLDDLEINIREGANKTKDCALEGDFWVRDPKVLSDLHKKMQWLRYMGSASTAENSGPIVLFTFCPIGWSSVFLFTFLYSNSLFCLTPLRFLMEPLEELQRHERVILDLAHNLTRNSKSHLASRNVASDHVQVRSLNVGHHRRRGCVCEINLRHERLKLLKLYSDSNDKMSQNDKDTIDFRFVRPACLSLLAYKLYLGLRSFFFISVTSSFFITTTVFGYAFIEISEYQQRSAHSSLIEKCHQWNPNAIPIIKDSLSLTRFESLNFIVESPIRTLQLEHYYYKFSQDIDLPTFYKGKSLLWMVEVIIACFITAIWTGFNLVTFIEGCLYRLLWISQIKRQMRECVQLMTRRANSHLTCHQNCTRQPEDMTKPRCGLATTMRPFSIGESRQISQESILIDDESHVQRALLVSYLNFNCFLLEDRGYMKFQDYGCNYLSYIGVAMVFLSSNIFLTITSAGLPFIWLSLMLIFVNVNMVYFFGVHILDEIRHLFHLSTIIVGLARSAQLSDSIIVRNFSRLLFRDNEVQVMFATKLAGRPFKHKNVLTLNSYALGAMILLYNHSYT